jgi:cytochrome c biogenesis factor
MHAPTQIVFLSSLILAIVGAINIFVAFPYFTQHPLWLLTAAYVLLAVGCTERSQRRAPNRVRE